MKKDGTSLIINGIRVDQSILKKEAVHPCGIDCIADCCSGGVWMNDDEPARIMEWKDEIKSRLPLDRRDESKWFVTRKAETETGIETGTDTVDDPMRPDETCCVFLQLDRKCALQVLSRENNLGWPGIKPFYCAIYPLYLEDGVFSIDEVTELDEETAKCRYSASEARPMFELYRDEAILILGEEGYLELQNKVAEMDQVQETTIAGNGHHPKA